MKVELRGSMATMQTEVTVEQWNKYKNYGVFTAKNEEGDHIFKLTHSVDDVTMAISKYGLKTNAVVDGKLAAVVLLTADEVETFVEETMPAFIALRANETIILNQIAEVEAQLNEVQELIDVE